MWKFGDNPSWQAVEERMVFCESLFEKYGAVPLDINKENRERFGQRVTYLFEGEYYRMDYITLWDKPFLVVEAENEPKLAEIGCMDDCDPFPYDLPDEEIEEEILKALEIELINDYPSREEVQRRMEFCESLFLKYGAVPLDINKEKREKFGERVTYLFQGKYYRMDSIAFPEKQCLVVEVEEDPDLAAMGVMEDASPFPYDLPDDEMEKEIRYSLGIEPYPNSWIVQQ